jgi:hypothetical protein
MAALADARSSSSPRGLGDWARRFLSPLASILHAQAHMSRITFSSKMLGKEIYRRL